MVPGVLRCSFLDWKMPGMYIIAMYPKRVPRSSIFCKSFGVSWIYKICVIFCFTPESSYYYFWECSS